MKKIEFFKIEGKSINRIRRHCPKCGPAVFLAEHKNRFSCGKCGYAEFKGGGKPSKLPVIEEKSVKQPVQEQQTEASEEETSVESLTPTSKPETTSVEEPSGKESSVEESLKEESSELPKKTETPPE